MGPWNAPFDGKEVWQLEESDASSSLWRIPSLDHGGTLFFPLKLRLSPRKWFCL